MTGIGSLAMYDGAGARDANDRLWTAVTAQLASLGVADAAPALDRGRPLDAILADPSLLLAQCCGLPLATRYRDRLRVVATPRYTAPGCAGAHHRSRIVVRVDDAAEGLADLRGARAAINERGSNTGTNLFRAAIAPLAAGRPFFADVVETGSHEASLRAVSGGRADVAAIDCVSYAHLSRDAPTPATSVRTIGWTAASPALPFVTAIATSDTLLAALRTALHRVVEERDGVDITGPLFLTGIEVMPAQAYDVTASIADFARSAGYPELV